MGAFPSSAFWQLAPTNAINAILKIANFFIVVKKTQTLHDVCNRSITQKEANKEKQHHESNVTVNYTNTLSTGNGNAKTKKAVTLRSQLFLFC